MPCFCAGQAQALVPRMPAVQRKQVLPAPVGLAQPMPFRYQALAKSFRARKL